jgi:hypothetical protein
MTSLIQKVELVLLFILPQILISSNCQKSALRIAVFANLKVSGDRMSSGEKAPATPLPQLKGSHHRKSTECGLCVKSIGMGYCIVYFVWSNVTYRWLHQSFRVCSAYMTPGFFINFSHHFEVDCTFQKIDC